MSWKVKRINPCRVRLEVEVEAWEVNAAFDDMVKHLRKTRHIDGWRDRKRPHRAPRGHHGGVQAPADFIEKRYEWEIKETLWHHLTATHFERASRLSGNLPVPCTKPDFHLPIGVLPRRDTAWCFAAEYYIYPVPSALDPRSFRMPHFYDNEPIAPTLDAYHGLSIAHRDDPGRVCGGLVPEGAPAI